MKRHAILLTAVVLAAAAVDSTCRAADPEAPSYEKHLLMLSPNEGCDVGDIDRDGDLDIAAGTCWFAGPDFVPRPLRDIEEFGNDYYRNNSEHLYDVDGDGWLDVVSGDWSSEELWWFRNPGELALSKGLKWERRLLVKGRGENEIYTMHDFDGDDVPEILVSSWIKDAPVVVWRFKKNRDGSPGLERIVLGQGGGGHGVAFGDLSGDGREDLLTEMGWYERPAGAPLAQPWKYHPTPKLPHPSCPSIITDLTGDGRNDIIFGKAHDYGLYWLEQGPKDDDGAATWTQHVIDESWSQAHALVWEDLDGDGDNELLAGKRVRGHAGKDPGADEPAVLFSYEWDPDAKKFSRHTISEEGVGVGMQPRVVDINDDGRLDIVTSGKTGTWVLINQGSK